MKKASVLFWILLVAAGLSVSGCGKVSAPAPLEGSGYPHSYPRQ